jgi:hypothetical protein
MKRSRLTLVMFVLVQVVIAGCILGESVRDGLGTRSEHGQVSTPPVASALIPGGGIKTDNGNSSTGRRRAGLPPKVELQFEGTITSASATSITVHDSHDADVVLALTSSTVIRHGDETIAAADLKVGDQVHVKATVQNNANVALEILVQRPKDVQEIEGMITAASATSITVHDSHGADVVLELTSSTVIRHGDQAIAAADLKVGDQVHVKADVQNNVNVALEILVQRPEDFQELEVEGTITAASASAITVHDQHGSDVILMLTSSTIIRKGGQTIAATDLAVGDKVSAKAVAQNTINTATQIEVHGRSSGHH